MKVVIKVRHFTNNPSKVQSSMNASSYPRGERGNCRHLIWEIIRKYMRYSGDSGVRQNCVDLELVACTGSKRKLGSNCATRFSSAKSPSPTANSATWPCGTVRPFCSLTVSLAAIVQLVSHPQRAPRRPPTLQPGHVVQYARFAH